MGWPLSRDNIRDGISGTGMGDGYAEVVGDGPALKQIVSLSFRVGRSNRVMLSLPCRVVVDLETEFEDL